MPKSYSQKEFNKDLLELETLINNQFVGGKVKKSTKSKRTIKPKKSVKSKKASVKKVKKVRTVKKVKKSHKGGNYVSPIHMKGMNAGAKKKKSVKKSTKKSTKKHHKGGSSALPSKSLPQLGGKMHIEGDERHFKVVNVDGKAVDFGLISIKKYRTPLSAAKKALRVIANHYKKSQKNKETFRATFQIYETTRGSSNKTYGPYNGYFHKYTKEEMAAATTKNSKGVKIVRQFKPMVHLVKRKGNAKQNNKSNLKHLKGGK